jgi:hypothetical protein
MSRNVIWANQAEIGLEHFYLWVSDDGILADGVVIGVEEAIAFRVRYQIHCDPAWRVRKVFVQSLDVDERAILFDTDGLGDWTDESGRPVAELQGCIDVDITATPFTNTLPIRRLRLNSGESAEINVVYFVIPEMQVRVEAQRYTRLETNVSGGRYKFESLRDGFTADIIVDADGLVEDYPGLFKRVWES